MSTKKTKNILDEFHYHEALDRTYMIGNILDNNLSEHPVIENDENLKKKVSEISNLLSELYQMIGSKPLKKHN